MYFDVPAAEPILAEAEMKRKTFWWLIGRLVVPPREFRRKRKRNIGSIVLIALVMIPLVVSILFMESMIQGMTDKYVLLQDGHIQAYDFVLGIDTLMSDDRIFSADHSATVFGIAYSKTKTSEVKVKGVYPSYFNEARLQEISIEGTLPEYSKSAVPSVMMSSTTAKTLGVAIGERIALMLVPDSGTISARPVLANIDAIYESGYRQLDATLMFMHIDDLLKFNTAGYSKRTEFIVQDGAADNLSSVIDSLRQSYDPNIRWATPDITFSDQLTLYWDQDPVVLTQRSGAHFAGSWLTYDAKKVVFVGDSVIFNQPPFLAWANLPALDYVRVS